MRPRLAFGPLTVAAVLLASTLAPVAPPAAAQAAFDIDAVTTRGASPSRPRLDVYARVPYGLLNFTNVPTGFQARYTATVDVYAVDGRGQKRGFVVSRTWERTIPVASYNAARALEAGDRTTQSLDLSPGRYVLQVQIEDESTHRTYAREIPAVVRDVSGAVALSDLALVERFDEATNTLLPRVGNRVGTDDESVQVFYEVYAAEAGRVRVTRDLVRARPTTEVAYTTTGAQTLRAGRNQVVATVPLRDLRSGDYLLRVRVHNEAGTTLLAFAEKKVEAEWEGLARHIRNLDDAIAQLRYVAKDRDIRQIREGATAEEKLARFRAYWTRLDPTPGTERNERMEEYYYRVDYANRRYGAGRQGWETDRGNVLIRFGEPDDVTRRPFSMGAKPYEVWSYPRLRRRFIFVDNTGFGDYRLLSPVWDERNNM